MTEEDLETTRTRLLGWAAALDGCDYYEILEIDEHADEVAIRAAYHRFASAFHPDSHASAPADVLALAGRVFQRGSEAYRVLSNPELRVRYDMAKSRGKLRFLPSELPQRPEAEHGARPLHEICRSAGAKLAADRATRLIERGDPRSARRELVKALEFDGNANPAIQERIDALDVVLYAMGDEES